MPWIGWPHLPQWGPEALLLLGRGLPQTPAPHPPLWPADAHAPCTCSRVQTSVRPRSGPLPCPDHLPSSPLPERGRTRAHRKQPVLSNGRGPRPGAGWATGRGAPPAAPSPCALPSPTLETSVLPPDRPHPKPFIKRRGDSTFRWTRPAAGAPWPRRLSSPMYGGAVAGGPASPARGSKVPRARVAVVVEFLLHVYHVSSRLLEGPVRPPAKLPQVAQLGQPGPRAICGGRGQGQRSGGAGPTCWCGRAGGLSRGRGFGVKLLRLGLVWVGLGPGRDLAWGVALRGVVGLSAGFRDPWGVVWRSSRPGVGGAWLWCGGVALDLAW